MYACGGDVWDATRYVCRRIYTKTRGNRRFMQTNLVLDTDFDSCDHGHVVLAARGNQISPSPHVIVSVSYWLSTISMA